MLENNVINYFYDEFYRNALNAITLDTLYSIFEYGIVMVMLKHGKQLLWLSKIRHQVIV